jgi:hypothetical protein
MLVTMRAANTPSPATAAEATPEVTAKPRPKQSFFTASIAAKMGAPGLASETWETVHLNNSLSSKTQVAPTAFK